MVTKLNVKLTEKQMRFIELLIERSDENSPFNDAEFSSAQFVLSAIREARYASLPAVK